MVLHSADGGSENTSIMIQVGCYTGIGITYVGRREGVRRKGMFESEGGSERRKGEEGGGK